MDGWMKGGGGGGREGGRDEGRKGGMEGARAREIEVCRLGRLALQPVLKWRQIEREILVDRGRERD